MRTATSGRSTATPRTATAIRSSNSRRDGKVLLTLGKPGQGGTGTDVFDRPTGIAFAPNGDIFVSEGHAPTLRQFAHHEVRQDRKVHQELRSSGIGRRRTEGPACAGLRQPGTPVRRRPQQQPRRVLRSGRQVPRRLEAVRQAERNLHRQERHALCLRFRIGRRAGQGHATIRAASAASAVGSVKDGKVEFYIPPPPSATPRFRRPKASRPTATATSTPQPCRPWKSTNT